MVARKALLSFPPGERAGALQALHEWVTPGRAASIAWVLGPSDVRYLLVPWSPDLADESLRDRVASALFEQRFGEDAAAHAVRFAEARFGHPQLAAFVAHGLVAELAAHAREARLRLESIAPALATVWSRFGPLLAREQGVVHLVDGDRQIAVRHERGRLSHIALRPFGGGCDCDAPRPAAADGAGIRRFSSQVPGADGLTGQDLRLDAGRGFDPMADAVYAFALCGVF
jgi:hypothetical protein